MTPTTLLTGAEVAEILGVSSRTILRLAASGDLPVAQRLPGKTGALLFDAGVVKALAAERRNGQATEVAS